MYNSEGECKTMAVALKKVCDQRGMSPHTLAN